MWLDRLAAQATSSGSSTPQPGSRPYSPAPRTASSTLSPYVTSQRPGVSPRVSSLSLVSNDSTSSLLPSSRKANNQGSRQSLLADPGTEPLEVLERILNQGPTKANGGGNQGPSICQADLEADFDFGGLSLRDLANRQPDNSDKDTRPVTKSEKLYQDGRARFEDLHRSITACDDVLNSVELNLTNFRNDLAAVSADIESLQQRSTSLNRRLENRQLVEKALSPMIEELSLSPETISRISEAHIDEAWVKTLGDVDKREAAHKKNVSAGKSSKASEDLGPLLEKLVLKAVERIRDFLVAQIKAMRSPNINAQIIQQTNFLRFKDLFTFLHKHQPQLATEIAQAYMNTMRWYYHNQFSRYGTSLGKIKLHVVNKNDTVGHDETVRAASALSASRANAFSIGRRVDILKVRHQTALSSYLAEEDQSTHYLEVPFRNFNLALVDNAAAEYTFMTSFFSPAFSFAQISKNLNYVFEPTFELGQTLTRSLSAETFDALGLLICIRLNQHFAFELQRRKVPALDGYINGTNMLLWPRLQVIMDRHCESVKHFTATLPSKPSHRTDTHTSAAPHPVTQRFGQLLHGLLALSTEADGDEPVVSSLQRLRSEVEAFLTKLSQTFSGEKRGRVLYNNYSLVLTIIGSVGGKLALKEQEHFEALKAKHEGG